jgi:hypothetical protein
MYNFSMSSIQTIIRYNGPVVENKQMDVSDLAPSLLSLSELIKDVNRFANGDRAKVKIFVNADLEQNCFELIVNVTQTVLDQMTSLINDHRVVAAKEILEWVGIISSVTGGTAYSLYKLIKFLKGKTVKDVQKVKENDRYLIKILVIDYEGNESTYLTSENIYDIYSSQSIRKKAVDVLSPLNKDGYDEIRFYKGKNVYESFKKTEVPNAESLPEVIPTNITKSHIKTVVRIRKPAYEGKSRWTLVYEKAIEASIEDEDWLNDFQKNIVSAPPNSSLEVEMIKEVVVDEHGVAFDEPVYRVIKVLRVIPPPDQLSLL